MSMPFLEAYYDQVAPRQLLLNKPVYGAPFPKQKVDYARLPFIKAIAYKLHISFGQYYQFQIRSVQFEICRECRTGRLFKYEL